MSSLVCLAAAALFGCDAPAGIIRVHFELSPPAAVDFGDRDPPPIDPMSASGAAGSVEAVPAEGSLTSELSGLPTPDSEHVLYRLWLASDAHDAAWVLAAELRPEPSGAASVHVEQHEIEIDLAAVRSAILTLEGHGEVGPGTTIILAGAAGDHAEDGEAPPSGTPDGGGGHTH